MRILVLMGKILHDSSHSTVLVSYSKLSSDMSWKDMHGRPHPAVSKLKHPEVRWGTIMAIKPRKARIKAFVRKQRSAPRCSSLDCHYTVS